MPLPPGHWRLCKISSLGRFQRMTSFTSLLKHVPAIYRGLCLTKKKKEKKKSFSCWTLKAEGSYRHQSNEQLAACSLPQAQGAIIPAGRWQSATHHSGAEAVAAVTSRHAPAAVSDQQNSSHRDPDSTLHSPAPPPQSTLNIPNFHTRRICKTSSSQDHTPADSTNLTWIFAHFCSLLERGWGNK